MLVAPITSQVPDPLDMVPEAELIPGKGTSTVIGSWSSLRPAGWGPLPDYRTYFFLVPSDPWTVAGS